MITRHHNYRILQLTCSTLMVTILLFLFDSNAFEFVRQWILDHDNNWRAYAASILGMTMAAASPLPAELVAITNIMAFGPWTGGFITWLGALIGASAVFWLTRLASRPLHNYKKQRWQTTQHWINRYGVYGLLFARLIPIIPFFMLNIAAGASTLSWPAFLAATALGILPMTLIIAFMASLI